MDKILLGSALAFFITYMAIPIIITVAEWKKLFDVPDSRKLHLTPVPSLGGLGIFAGVMMSLLLSVPFRESPEFQYFTAAALVIFFLGMKDDILVISPMKKLLGQFIAAFIVMQRGGVKIVSMHGFLGLQEIPEAMSVTLTLFTIIVVVNSFNLIDGIDGLAATLGIITTTVFGIYFFNSGELSYALLSFITTGSLLGFLIFNHAPARIFMGDTGSLLLGMVNAILVVHFIAGAGSVTAPVQLVASPAMGFAILMVPLFDTLRVFSIRILNRRSPFSPDKNHIHHLLLDLGLKHSSVTYILASANLLMIGLAYALSGFGSTVGIVGLIAAASLLTAFLLYRRRVHKEQMERMYGGSPTIDMAKIMSFRKKRVRIPEDN
jgi:UDP-N-acetylmuramyl pentapeptide phosphotransferase/UDP-N-acetylglucosamine-1-phosphate transferase